LLRARLEYGSRANPPRVVTQIEVGKELGVSGVAVGGWEADRNEPGLDNLRALARLYGVRVGWLVDGELPMRANEGEQGAATQRQAPSPRGPAVWKEVEYLDPAKPTQPQKGKGVGPKKPGRSAMAS
jgi:transcriptional regulator with XRE-family HTH domain